MVKSTIGAAAYWLASLLAGAAVAQDYPTRPVTMVVPFAAGGPIDVLGRMLAPALGEALGQPVVIENMSGGGGMPGAYRVSQAPPDGYQFVLGSIGTGTSAHIGCLLLNQAIGVEVIHVPYRGGGPALGDLVAGRLDYMCNYISLAAQAVEAGQVGALAIFSRERSPVMPSLPTAAEQGLSGVYAYTWNAIFLPKGTPPAIVARLNAAVSRAMDSPAARARLDKLGLDIPPAPRRTPDYLGQYVAAEIAKWAPPIKASGVTEE